MKELKLKYPISMGDQKIDKLTFGRLTGAHLKDLKGEPTFGDICRLGCLLAGQDPLFFELMDATDCIALAEVVANFLGSSRKIGGTA